MNHHRLYLYLTVLGVWLILSSAAVVWTDPKKFVLILVLMTFVTITSALNNIFKNTGWIITVISILVIGVAQFSAAGFSSTYWLNTGISVMALFGTCILSNLTGNQLQNVFGQLDRDRKLIEEMQIYDPETGLLKWTYARQSLKAEINRSQRFHSDLCLMLLQVEHWDPPETDFSSVNLKELKTQISEIITTTLRTVDISFSNGKIGAILPGTRPEGAMIAAQRLVNNSIRKAHVAINIGISHFPMDGVTEEEIVKAAEAALSAAVNSERPIVQSDQMHFELGRDSFSEPQPGDELTPKNIDKTDLT
ncbi:MAG TPA: GGDEF domain-containing protein [Anaerolineaceae bacterium]|nr:GGDEF domain-containing protein [Anaerolineaceae bacterium]